MNGFTIVNSCICYRDYSRRRSLLLNVMFLRANFPGLLVVANKSSRLVRDLIRRSVAHAHRTKYEMKKVYLRNASGSHELHINFRYNNPSYNLERNFNFCRNINEKVSDALNRIRNNIEKELSKKLRKTKLKGMPLAAAQTDERLHAEELSIEIFRNDYSDSFTDVTFAEMLAGRLDNLLLKITDQTFEIVVNKPWVINLVLPTTVLAGFKVYPSKLDMQFAEREFSKAKWYRARKPKSGDLERGTVWSECGDGFFYNTTNEDVGLHLKFELTPGNSSGEFGPAVEIIAKNEVQAGTGTYPFEMRHCFTTERLSGDALRVVTYNLLADLYADSDYSRTQLFPYCPPHALKIDYRKQLFLKEIEGYNADVVCLQEVDLKIFEYDLKTVLETPELKYTGLIEQKGTCGEGIATFYRNDRFTLIKRYGLNIGKNIRELPLFEDIWSKIESNQNLSERICDRATTLQLTLLKCMENERYVLVANTHLYFHPDADHIRLLQFGFTMRYVEHEFQNIKQELNLQEGDISLIFCGDFNSVPKCGIYKLMTENFVDSDLIDWSSNEKQAVKNVSLTQPFKMKSACGTPLYTNFTHAFSACLDYIFYDSDRLEVQQVIPIPTEEELRANTAIPSVVFPSDHIALVADLKFK